MFLNNSVFYKPIRSRDTLKMAPMITAELTMQGKPNYRDKNNFSYVFNGERAETKLAMFPTHGHTNKLLKTKAKEG